MKRTLIAALICASSIALRAENYGPIVFVGPITTGSWTAVSGAAGSVTSGGVYTNAIAYTNVYRIGGTNYSGRLPLGSNVVVSWTGSSTSNAVALTWTRKYGVVSHVIELSRDSGSTWTNWIAVGASVTNFVDRGTNAWQTSDFSAMPVIPASTAPWSDGSAAMATGMTAQASADAAMSTGTAAQATATAAMSTGTAAQASADSAMATGMAAQASADAAMSTGTAAQASASAAMSTGMAAQASADAAAAVAAAALPNPYTPDVEFTYSTNNGAITIETYLGSNSVLIIPPTINGMQVKSIGVYGQSLTADKGLLTDVTIPSGLIQIVGYAFNGNTNLARLAVPTTVTNIGSAAFLDCHRLEHIDIPEGLTDLNANTLRKCYALKTVKFPSSLTTIWSGAASWCTNLTAVYWEGNGTYVGSTVYEHSESVTNYYRSGSSGFGATLGDRPTALWGPKPLASLTIADSVIMPDQYGVGAIPAVWRTNEVLGLDGSTNTLIYLGAP